MGGGGGGGSEARKVVTKGVNYVGMYPEKQETGKQVSQTSPGVSPGYAEVFDEDASTHQPSIDSSDPNWRDNLRKEVIEQNRQGDAVELDNENDKYDQHLRAPAISSVKEVAKLANRMSEFADWHGMERLSSAVFRLWGGGGGGLLDAQLKSAKQSIIDRFVSSLQLLNIEH